MAWNNFRLQVVLRVLLLTAGILVAIWGWVATPWVVTPVVALLAAVLLGGELVWYIERSQREFSAFLSSIVHQDYSVPVPAEGRGRSFDQLGRIYALLSAEFKRLNLQKAANHQYLEAVVEHVGVALISLDDEGRIVMMNRPARALFSMPQAGSLAAFGRFDARLPALLRRMQDGDQELLRVQRAEEVLQIVVYVTGFTLLDQRYRLVSFQDIRDELERREIESWQKLIRVLTHEIMNSVTPIISLSKLAQETLEAREASGVPLRDDERRDLLRSVNAVHSRSSGLLDFVKAYRSFASVPAPAMQGVVVAALLERAHMLMREALSAQSVTLAVQCAEPDLVIQADPQQLEQVLINLLRNAIEALGNTVDPAISLRAGRDERGRPMIQVIDNGPGIDPAHLDNIFVPFFTTKRGGSGVGLSISRQLVQANRGFISVRPAEPRGSAFTLLFPAAGASHLAP